MNTFKKINQRGESSLVQTIMVAALIVSAFFIGMLWTKVKFYEKAGVGSTGQKVAGLPTDPSGLAAQIPQKPEIINVDPITDEDYVRGNRDARVAMIEYSDMECPFCKKFHPTAQEMVAEYGEKVMWVYRHFPLDNLHSKARPEAIAAECANKLGGQDNFWAFIDRVYEITPANNGLDAAKLPEIAGELGLNIEAFKTCQTSDEMAANVENDYQSGISAGINGTPGVILYDTKTKKTYEIPGAVPYDQLKQMIDTFLTGLK